MGATRSAIRTALSTARCASSFEAGWFPYSATSNRCVSVENHAAPFPSLPAARTAYSLTDSESLPGSFRAIPMIALDDQYASTKRRSGSEIPSRKRRSRREGRFNQIVGILLVLSFVISSSDSVVSVTDSSLGGFVATAIPARPKVLSPIAIMEEFQTLRTKYVDPSLIQGSSGTYVILTGV